MEALASVWKAAVALASASAQRRRGSSTSCAPNVPCRNARSVRRRRQSQSATSLIAPSSAFGPFALEAHASHPMRSTGVVDETLTLTFAASAVAVDADGEGHHSRSFTMSCARVRQTR